MIMTTTLPHDAFSDRAFLHSNSSIPEAPSTLADDDRGEETRLSSPFLLRSKQFQIPVADAILHTFTRRTHGPDLGTDFEPLARDVVCGRGKGSYNRPGNIDFRKVVRRFVGEYATAKTKFEKTTVLNRIIDAVHHDNDARFLKFNTRTHQWFEITDDQAREKVGHTMRETIAALEVTQHEERKHHDLLSNQKAIFASMLRRHSSGTGGHGGGGSVRRVAPPPPPPQIPSFASFGVENGLAGDWDHEPLPWPRSEV